MRGNQGNRRRLVREAKKVPLSVVVFTKNKSIRLHKALNSVAWADELIIVADELTKRFEAAGLIEKKEPQLIITSKVMEMNSHIPLTDLKASTKA